MILNPQNNYFDTSKPVIESLIDECDIKGEYGYMLTDERFSQALDEYNMEEETLMELMSDYKKTGHFVRVTVGWIFIYK